MKNGLIFLMFIGLLTSVAMADEEDGDFSSTPINMAEVVLESILTLDRLSSNDDRFGPFAEFIVGYPKRDTDFDHLYEPFFSPKLLQAWRKAERDAVVEDCGGEYIDGQLCGLGHNPLTCAQDIPRTGYMYNTLMEDDAVTLIAMAWKGYAEQPTAVYQMVKRKEHWVLHNVTCLNEG